MLSIFPEILFLAPFAATLLRLALAALFTYAAWKHIERTDTASRVLGGVEILTAFSLFLGLWTQPGALLGTIIVAIWLFQKSARVTTLSTILLALPMCLSLLILGAGALAFDLPL